MATIYYSLSTRTNARGYSRVLIRLSGGANVTPRAKTEVYIHPSSWDAKRKRIVVPRVAGEAQRAALQAQRDLDDLSLSVLESFEQLRDRREATSEWLGDVVYRFHHPQVEVDRAAFFVAFDAFVAAKRYAYDRHKSMLGLKRILQRFELFVGQPLTLEAFDSKMIGRIDRFFADEAQLCRDPRYSYIYEAIPEVRRPAERAQNTINGYHTRLRTFIRWCVAEELTSVNGYSKFKVDEDVYGTPIYISVEDRKRLYDAPMPSEALSIQRDIFVFQCLTGCRVGDLVKFTRHNIINGSLEYVASKTRDGHPVTVRVPLSATATEIIERYKGGEKLLPFIEKQSYNRAIKKCFKAAGMKQLVTWLNPKTREAEQRPLYEVASSHLARRTFAGNLYKQLKDPNVIASMTGHTEGSRAFARYRSIDDQIKAEAVDLLE